MDTPTRALQRHHEETALHKIPSLEGLDAINDKIETFSKLEMVSTPRSGSRRSSLQDVLIEMEKKPLKINLAYEEPFRMATPDKDSPMKRIQFSPPAPSPMERRRQFFNLQSNKPYINPKSKVSNLVNPILLREGKRQKVHPDVVVVQQDDEVAKINAKYNKKLARPKPAAEKDSSNASSRSTSQLTGWKTPQDIRVKENAKIHNLKTPHIYIVNKSKKKRSVRRPKSVAVVKRVPKKKRVMPTKKKDFPKDEAYKHLPHPSFRSKTDRFASLGRSSVPAATDYDPSDEFKSNTNMSYQGASSCFKSQNPRFEHRATNAGPLCYGQELVQKSPSTPPPQIRALNSNALKHVRQPNDLRTPTKAWKEFQKQFKKASKANSKKKMKVKGQTTKSDLYQLFELMSSNRNTDDRIDSLMSQIDEMEEFLSNTEGL